MTLSIRVANRDKAQMVEALHQFKANPKAATAPPAIENWEKAIAPRYAQDDVSSSDWFTFDKPVLYV
jgi:hypothetical protein